MKTGNWESYPDFEHWFFWKHKKLRVYLLVVCHRLCHSY
jgi:hypothetical protein